MKKLKENEIIEKVFFEGLFSNISSKLKNNIREETVNNAVRDFIKKLSNYPRTARKDQLIEYLIKFADNNIIENKTEIDNISVSDTLTEEKYDLKQILSKFEFYLKNNTLISTGQQFFIKIIENFNKNPNQFIINYNKNAINNNIAERFYELKNIILNKIKEYSAEKNSSEKKTAVNILEKIYQIMNKEK